MSDGLQIPEHLWKALELMEEEMGVPKNNLVCQAIFTLARLNGYVVAGQVSLSRGTVEPPLIAGREEPPKTPRDSAHEAPPPPSRSAASSTPRPPPALRVEPPPPSRAEPLPLVSQDTSPRYVVPPPPPLRRRDSLLTPPPSQTPTALEVEEEVPEEPHTEEEAYEEREDSGVYPEADIPHPPTLYIEIPGEQPVAMEGDECIIGRGKSCHFVIDSNRVSRQHARILRDGEDFVLEDLNSSNGTFFGKQREKVTRRVIADGDEFIFGTERVTFLIQ